MASRRPAPNPTYGAGNPALLGSPIDYSGATFEPSDPFAALAGSPLMGPALVPTGGAVPSSLDLSGTPLGEALNGPEMTLLRQMAPPPQLEPLPDLSGMAPQGFMERLAAQTGGNPIPFPTAVPPSGGAGFLAGLLHGLGQGLVGPPSAALQARQLQLASRVEAVNKANEAKIKDYYASKAEQQKNIAQALLDSAKARGGRTLSIPAYLQDTAKSFGYQPDEKVNPAEMMRLTASGPMSPEKFKQQLDLATSRANLLGQSDLGLDPETQEFWSKYAATTGQLPPLGTRAMTTRRELLVGAARAGRGTDVAANRAAYQSAQRSLSALTLAQNMTSAFESTANKNADVMLNVMQSLKDSGSPLLNKPLRAWDLTVAGSQEVAAYRTALQIVAPEFARVLTANPNLAGELHEGAREDVKKMLAGEYTIPQMVAAVNVLRQDARNRNASYARQMAQVHQSISDIISGRGAIGGPPPGAKVERWEIKDGKPVKVGQ